MPLNHIAELGEWHCQLAESYLKDWHALDKGEN